MDSWTATKGGWSLCCSALAARGESASLPGRLAGLLAVGCLTFAGCVGYAVPSDLSLLEAARAASAREDWPAALDYWRRAIERPENQDPLPYREAARALIGLGEIESAQLMLDRGIELFPEDVELRLMCGQLLCDRGFRRAAELNYQVVVRKAPRHADAWLSLAEVQLDLDLPANAKRAVDRYIELEGPCTEALYLRGSIRAQIGDLSGAMTDFSGAFADPEVSGERLTTAAAVVTEERYSEADEETLLLACSWTERALEMDPQDAEASYVKGMIHEQQGDDLGAVEAYERSVELVNHLLAMTRLAQAYARLGEFDRADAMIDRALDLNVHASHRRMLERVRRAWH